VYFVRNYRDKRVVRCLCDSCSASMTMTSVLDMNSSQKNLVYFVIKEKKHTFAMTGRSYLLDIWRL
jgi:hypothetical protein